jgi:hypothetical protein
MLGIEPRFIDCQPLMSDSDLPAAKEVFFWYVFSRHVDLCKCADCTVVDCSCETFLRTHFRICFGRSVK